MSRFALAAPAARVRRFDGAAAVASRFASRFAQTLSRGVLLGALATLGGGALAAPAAAQDRPERGFAALAERFSPAVVDISTAQTVDGPARGMPRVPEGTPFEDFFNGFQGGDGAPQRVQSLGSGFVIDPTGYVVTNNHVIEGADEIEVRFTSGETLPAELIGRDAETDLALLKVTSDDPLPFVSFGDSDAVRVGDWVLAIGNPFGFGGSVSAGIISARNRNINSGRYDDFFQTDAAINRGNSGGPLFNMEGEVIGVNTAIISPSGGSIGIGFSRASNQVDLIVEQLRAYGQARRGWLGVSIRPVDDDMAAQLGLQDEEGALVSAVDPEGPSYAAGILEGDVILRFDNRVVESVRDLLRLVAETEVGKRVTVELVRNGESKVIDVEIALLDETKEEAAEEETPPEFAALAMEFAPLTDELRARYSVPSDVEGVLVAKVDPASSAYEGGMRVGDVVVEVSREAVTTPEEVIEKIDAARDARRPSVFFFVNRAGDDKFVTVDFEN